MLRVFSHHALSMTAAILLAVFIPVASLSAQVFIGSEISTTTVYVSICGDSVINDGEQCDVPGETGTYSTSIAGRQCSTLCQFGPYCGDAILQTIHDEECDDGNNTSGDFCSATCQAEPSGAGGGGSSGSGGGSSGGSNEELGDTSVSIQGKAYPQSNVNIVKDGSVIGVVRADSNANFSFNTESTPGTASFGFWATDSRNVRSLTLNTTFEVIQGAVTNVNGIFIPPTISVNPTTVPSGGTVTIRGQSAPDVDIKTSISTSPATVLSAETDEDGEWTIPFSTAQIPANAYTAKAKFEFLNGGTKRESTFGQVTTFFVGVSPNSVVTSSDLNRDGKVNLVDFSILVFWWGTDGGASNPSADINNNNRVGLEDFSILLFNWTG